MYKITVEYSQEMNGNCCALIRCVEADNDLSLKLWGNGGFKFRSRYATNWEGLEVKVDADIEEARTVIAQRRAIAERQPEDKIYVI